MRKIPNAPPKIEGISFRKPDVMRIESFNRHNDQVLFYDFFLRPIQLVDENFLFDEGHDPNYTCVVVIFENTQGSPVWSGLICLRKKVIEVERFRYHLYHSIVRYVPLVFRSIDIYFDAIIVRVAQIDGFGNTVIRHSL